MIIDEESRKDIFLKYINNTSDELLTFLKRHYPTHVVNREWMEHNDAEVKLILVQNKFYNLKGNKKFLVNKIDSDLSDKWLSVEPKIRRRTIKKYLDGVVI